MNRRIVNRLIACLGVAVVAVALAITAVTFVGQRCAVDKAAETVAALYAVMPEQKKAAADDRVNQEMPMLETDGVNYIGILEVPKFGCTLPIGGIWDSRRITRYPHRFTGSVYDATLVIGGSDQAGQLDFVTVITTGDVLFIVDTEGNRYSFQVEEVTTTKDVSRENLCAEEYDLTLFARNVYAFDYTVVRCCYKSS